MFQILRNAWKTPDIRKKLLYTILVIIIFRIGSAIPVPFIDPSVLRSMVQNNSGMLGYIDMLTGGAFSNATLFALSITPYINASIIIQLLTIAIPALERLAKEGEEGKKTLNRITRYTTIGLTIGMSILYYYTLKSGVTFTTGLTGVFTATVIVGAFSAGSLIVVWLGEQANEKGIGNGISIILFAGIISRLPSSVESARKYLETGEPQYYIWVPLMFILGFVLIVLMVILTNAERRIPVQYAKRVVGRKQYGGQNTFMPIKVNMSGVMPIIFASAFVSIPATIAGFLPPKGPGFYATLVSVFSTSSWVYALVYFILIILFNYFYVSIQYNPIEMANNLRKNNGAIPGIRPGKPTSDFIMKVLLKIVLVGALFLAIAAVAPIIIQWISKMQLALAGTSVLIVVGVALETVRTLESLLMMRHYKGFLE